MMITGIIITALIVVLSILLGRYILSKRSASLTGYENDLHPVFVKKKASVDVGKIRPLIFRSALMLSVAMVLLAFNIKSEYVPIDPVDVFDDTEEFDEEIPATAIKEPEKKKPVEKKNPVVFFEPVPEPIPEPDPDPVVVEKPIININDALGKGKNEGEKEKDTGEKDIKIDKNKVYPSGGVDKEAEFPGGIDAFRKYVANNFNTRCIVETNDKGGNINIGFVVNKEGKITNVRVSNPFGCNAEKQIIKLLKNAPQWTPAEYMGMKVNVAYGLPLNIVIK